MARKDPLKILEAAYSFDLSEDAWVRGLVEATKPYDLGEGIIGHVADVKSQTLRAVSGSSNVIDLEAFKRVATLVPPWLFKRLNAPGPVAQAYNPAADLCERMGVPPSAISESGVRSDPRAAMFVVAGGDPHVETVLLGLTGRGVRDLRGADRKVLDGVAAHLGAAQRLRSLLGGPPAADDDTSEAVLAPDGKVLDARGRAVRERTKLADAVKRFDRARTRKATAEERVELWTALVEGRWSIVESSERDGKRIVLACRNEPRTVPMRRLTSRERSVLQYVAVGHPLKYVGYELGISLPAVSQELKSAMRKLGLRTRAEVIRTFGA